MKISFVIPAFNMEAYVGRCLDSILGQPFDNFEIIVINDGSTDGTAGVLAKYKDIDHRICVYEQKNSGQGAARSFGITKAEGDYIWFVDSDDWLLDSVLLRVANILQARAPDVMLINYEFSFDEGPSMPSSAVPAHLAGEMIVPRESSANFAAVSCWNTPPWRLISRRQHLIDNGIQFAKGVFYEDHPYAIHLMLTAQSVYVDGSVSYSYYQRATSTTKVNDSKSFDFLEIRKQCIELFRRFEQLDNLAPVVTGYLAPANFYAAHVAPPFKAEFIRRLHEDLTEEESAFIRQNGDWATNLFAKAVRANDPGLITQIERMERLKRRYSRAGAKRQINRIRNFALSRAAKLFTRARAILIKQTQHVGVDATGQRFLTVGKGTRVEPIYIDVRVKQDSRPYVTVGEYSHIGGTFVFERGVGRITIGDKSSIGGGCKLICTQEGGIHIGSHVMLSWDCTVIDSNSHSLNPEIRANDAYDWKCGVDAGRIGAYKDWSQVESSPIVIDDNVWIGFESAIMKGVHIGKGSVIASKSVVTKDVAPFNIVGGSPAKFIGFTPRDKWTWEEIVHAFQGDPSKQEMLLDSYLHSDMRAMLTRYRESEEFRDTAALVRQNNPSATTMLDVGGSNGVIGIAFALEGFNVTLVEPSSDTLVGTQAAAALLAIAAEEIDPTATERVKIITGFIEDAELTEGFDFINCRQVAHHFIDPVAALKKIRSLVKPDGIVLLVREHVIFDEPDKASFLENHPFQSYYLGENAYSIDEYHAFAEAAEFVTCQTLTFKETPINYFPHNRHTIADIDEQSVPGRPYTFVLKPSGLQQ